MAINLNSSYQNSHVDARSIDRAVTISTKKTINILKGFILFFVLGSLMGQICIYVLDRQIPGFDAIFNVDIEANFPTWYSSSSLLLCSILLSIIAIDKQWNKNQYFGHWWSLSIIFAYLSMDETASIHNLPTRFLLKKLHTTAFFYDAWVIVGFAFVLVVCLSYLRFVAHLPGKTRRLFIVAGIIFVIGAIGLEMISANYAYYFGENNLIYATIAIGEEFCEMVGILVFINALLSYINSYVSDVQLRFKP